MFRLVHRQIQTRPWTTKARGGLSSTTRANAPSVTREVRLSVEHIAEVCIAIPETEIYIHDQLSCAKRPRCMSCIVDELKTSLNAQCRMSIDPDPDVPVTLSPSAIGFKSL